MKDLLELTQAYSSETDYSVWTSVSMMMSKLELLLGTQTALLEKLHSFGRRLYTPIFNELGWDPKPEDSKCPVVCFVLCLEIAPNCGLLDHWRNPLAPRLGPGYLEQYDDFLPLRRARYGYAASARSRQDGPFRGPAGHRRSKEAIRGPHQWKAGVARRPPHVRVQSHGTDSSYDAWHLRATDQASSEGSTAGRSQPDRHRSRLIPNQGTPLEGEDYSVSERYIDLAISSMLINVPGEVEKGNIHSVTGAGICHFAFGANSRNGHGYRERSALRSWTGTRLESFYWKL